MGSANERDVLFAAAGLLWGTVTLYSGLQRWRDEQKRFRTSSASTFSFSVVKSDSPSVIVIGAALSLGCLSYLLWSLWK